MDASSVNIIRAYDVLLRMAPLVPAQQIGSVRVYAAVQKMAAEHNAAAGTFDTRAELQRLDRTREAVERSLANC